MSLSGFEDRILRTKYRTLFHVCETHAYQTTSGAEPVREWLKELPAHERQAIVEDIKAVQFRWPLGMPLVRKLSSKIWEVRTQLPTRIARVLFTAKGRHMVLLHGFIKKTQATPVQDIELALNRIDF